jgi:uncharacterized protein YuzE
LSPKRKTAGKKAAATRKHRAAGKRAAATRKRRTAGKKAAKTRVRKTAAKNAAATRARRRKEAVAPRATMPQRKMRREPRTSATGKIMIEVSPDGKVIGAELSDESPHGFAIHHDYENFVTGQQVHVLHEWGKKAARLVWVGTREGVMAAGFETD